MAWRDGRWARATLVATAAATCLLPSPAVAGPLAAALATLMADPNLAGASVGLVVQRLSRNHEMVFAHRPDAQLVPASNVKLVTTLATLEQLGPDYQFPTEVFGTLRPDGEVEGDLFVKGFGDPSLVPERIWLMASRLRFRGVTRVSGRMVVDDSFFAGESRAFGYQADTTGNAYMAPAGALSASFNALMVHLLPGAHGGEDARVLVEPASAYARVVGRVVSGGHGRSKVDAQVSRHDGRDVISVSGHFAPSDAGRGVWRRVNEPARFFGEVFKESLRQVGVEVAGEVVAGQVPAQATKLMRFSSPRLGEVIGPLNKYSNNFMAAQLAFVLGAEVHGAPGTWDKGRRAIEHFLASRIGLSPGSYTLRNASGLHEVNLFSARQLARVVAYGARSSTCGPEFLGALATAGGIGTLQDRMHDTPAVHRLRAKTGTLAGAAALSGVVPTRDSEQLVFSLLINGFRRLEGVWAVQDRLATLLSEATVADL